MQTPSVTHDMPARDGPEAHDGPGAGDGPGTSSPASENNSTPDDWTRHLHPSGLPYRTCDKYWAVTFEDVNNPEVLQKINTCIHKIKRRMDAGTIDLSADCEIFVELCEDQSVEDGVTYRIVNHAEQWLYWISTQGTPVYESQDGYWNHFCKTPMHHVLPENAEDDMLGALAHFYTEHINDDRRTTSPFSHEQCEQLISLYETLRQETPEDAGIRAWFVSRVLTCVWKARKSYRYGKFDAIISIEPEEEEPPSWKQQLLNIFIYTLCFGTHQRYLTQLRHAHTNGGLHVPAFQRFLEGMLQEWTDSNLLGTVFISANMAFLAVQQIENFQRTVILVSTFFSMASIISGVHHLWKHRPKTHADIDETKQYVHHGDSSPQAPGLMFSAMFLSLPLVFLLWSVISFAIALLAFAFRNSPGVIRGFLAGIVALIVFSAICVRIFFYRIWEAPDRENETLSQRLVVVAKGMKERLRSMAMSKGSLPYFHNLGVTWRRLRDRFRDAVEIWILPRNREVAETQI